MDLRCAVGDAWEILANIGGNRGHAGSCALKALPNVQKGPVGTSGARYWRCVAIESTSVSCHATAGCMSAIGAMKLEVNLNGGCLHKVLNYGTAFFRSQYLLRQVIGDAILRLPSSSS
jgi:hypothetical protein